MLMCICHGLHGMLPYSSYRFAVHNDRAFTLLTWILCVQAETSGTVSKMLVENGTPVTPGQPLLVIKS